MKEIKNALRQKARNIIALENEKTRYYIGENMGDILFGSPLWQKAECVFCFYSLPSEPCTVNILNRALTENKKLILPRCEKDGQMSLHIITSLNDLTAGAYNILEPRGNNLIPKEEIDLALLPCLAASLDGSRLGKGGGYYDRFLQGFKGQTVILCRDSLLFENGSIPMESHDIYAKYILTETKLVEVSK